MRTNFKRITCLFLTLVMLMSLFPVEALAVGAFGPSSGTASGGGSGGGGNRDTAYSPAYGSMLGAGILLHVEKSKFNTATPESYQKVIDYWAGYWPNTRAENSTPQGCYVVPHKHDNYRQEAIQMKENGDIKYSRAPVYGVYMYDQSTVKNNLGADAYNAAKPKQNAHNPNFSLPGTYWQKKINDTSSGVAGNIVSNLFSANDSNMGYRTQADMDGVIARVNDYLGLTGSNSALANGIMDETARKVWNFMNYCGFLATVIAVQPPDEKAALAKQLDEMCQSYLKGEAYFPMVVTGEIIVASEYNNNGAFCHWWTAKQCIMATTRKASVPDQGWWDSPPSNLLDAIARDHGHGGTESAGGLQMYGTPKSGSWLAHNNKSQYGYLLSSIDASFLSAGREPIPGFGVWGLGAEPPEPLVPVPAVKEGGEMTPMGTCGIEVKEESYVEESLSYSEELEVTINVNLSGSTNTTIYNDGAIEDTLDGVGVANSLRWLKQYDTTGANKPEIWIFVKYTDPSIKATTAEAAQTLVDRTFGYFGSGSTPQYNLAGVKVTPEPDEENAAGINVTWQQPNLSQLVWQDPGAQGFTCTVQSDRINIKITDYDAAIAYFDTHGSNLVFKGTVPVSGNLDDEDDEKQIWFKVGSNVHMGGPRSLDDMHTIVQNTVSLRCLPKYDWVTIRGKPEEKPFYYSQYKTPYSEVKQGTVPISGGGSSEKFNAMTGTPTFTETHNRDCTSNGANTIEQSSGMNPTGVRSDLMGTAYENNGHYYQYFASGGSEFIVQFDGEYVKDKTATRTFTFNFGSGNCSASTIAHVPAGAHTSGDPPTPCSGEHDCPHGVHYTCNPHVVGTNTLTFSINYTGLSYIQIKNLKVWKLARAEFEGNETYTLLDTDEVYAEVQSVAPELNYNIAGADSGKEGRLVYSFMPAGTNGDPDNLVWNLGNDTTCGSGFNTNMNKVKEVLQGAKADAICVSDFIVLNTSNGDQSILYYEYECADKGLNIMDSISTTSWSPKTGSDMATITVTSTAISNGIKFDTIEYDEMWTNNSKTSEGCKLPEDGITYGGYNGDYMSMSTKYKSQGHPKNITWSSTTAYKNESKVYGAKTNSALNKKNVTQKFRLMNDKIVIPDNKQNGEYILGRSYIFYENIVNFGPDQPLYPIGQVERFDNQKGFELETTYSPNHSKLNDLVVYNPVSNQYAMLISLPEERDQRSLEHEVYHVQEDNTCPGNAACPYLKQECSITTHYHTEACFVEQSYEVHTGFNVHEHTDECKGTRIKCGPSSPCMASGTHNSAACPYGHSCNGCTTCHVCEQEGGGSVSAGTCDCSHCGNPACPNYCANHQYPCSETCTIAHPVPEYICDDKPLNKHVCGADAGGMAAGTTTTYSFTGGIQKVELPAGTYKLEAYGASGGNSEHGTGGGNGGYSAGTVTFSKKTTLYIGVGEAGTATGGGYNGGGPSAASSDSAYGGGATHFATSDGTLAALKGNPASVLLVAGGGGAGGCNGYGGGHGGGANQDGTPGTSTGTGEYGSPGPGGKVTGIGDTMSGTNAADFGQGGWSTGLYNSGGGGGGLYGGSAGNNVSGGGASGGGGSGYAAASVKNPSGSTGTNSGNGYAKLTAISVNPVKTCYTVQKSTMSCADPHHAYSYYWKIYTYQLYHTSGRKCTGQNCTDTTSLLFPTQKEYTISQCQNGGLVRHANGEVHLTTSNMKNGVCAFCGKSYQTYIADAQNYNRAIGADEWSHYDYGDARCWAPCGNPNNHTSYVNKTTDENGVVIEMGDFINLDWPFTIYFPNTGDFYGTGRKASGNTTAERGYGYTNGMDTTEWVLHKWVEFPFAVLHKGVTYVPYERIYLTVPETKFEFYVPLQDHEYSNAEIVYGTVAINTQNGDQIECGKNENHNIKEISYMGRPMAHQHNADKRQYIDVVGRIGSLAIEDTGDWRWANFFKQPISTGWIVENIVRNVNLSVQNSLVIDQVDVRGVSKDNPTDSTGHNVYLDTYGTKTERDRLGNDGKLYPFPLVPSINNITALRRQPVRLGYDTLLDFETLGDYTGDTWGDTTSFCLIKPHFYRMDINTGDLKPVDVYMDSNGKKVLINDFDSRTISYAGKDSSVYLNWQDTAERRNYSGKEVTFTNQVAENYEWVKLPSGTSWFYGNFNILNLTQRNRTFIGSQDTYGWTKDPSEKLPDVQYSLQGQRWHFGINLPSSSSFVFSGDMPTTENIDKCIPDTSQYVIIGALEIYAQGETWTLVYDGKTTNQPFQITPTSPVVDPAPPNPKDPEKEMPIVVVYSPNHSSKEDLNVSGTH